LLHERIVGLVPAPGGGVADRVDHDAGRAEVIALDVDQHRRAGSDRDDADRHVVEPEDLGDQGAGAVVLTDQLRGFVVDEG